MKSARVQLIENTTEKVSRILAENYGVRVVYKGDLCCTDGKRIFLPVISDNAPEEFIETIPGMVDHETGHIIDTDFEVGKQLKGEKHAKKLHQLTNLCEDARIELAQINRWRGCRTNLERLTNWACKRLIKDWDKLSAWGKITQLCAGVAACNEDHWFVKEAAQLSSDLWEYVKEVVPLLNKAKDQKDTAAELSLAREILEKLHQLADPEPEPEEGDDENNDDQKKKQNKKQRKPNGKKPDQEDDEPGSFFDETEDDEAGEDEDDNDLDEEAPECLNRDHDLSDQEIEQDAAVSNRQRMIQDEARQHQSTSRGTYMVYSTERDVIAPVKGGNAPEARRLLEESRQITNVMRMKMMRNLLAKNRARRDPGKERGKIDRRSLFRVSLGTSKKVFWQQVEAPEFNTRASLWVDHSGSMHGQKLKLASEAALLFGEVLDVLKIPFEVCGFSTSTKAYEGQDIYEAASPADQRIFTRWGGLWVGVYKSFDEPWHAVKHRCSSMERHNADNTYDGETLRLAARRLLEYPEPRRILFWFNDGEPFPNIPSFVDDHAQYLKKVAKEVEKMIEVFAVGIMSSAVKKYYSNCVVINNLNDLPSVMLGELDRLLRKNQQAYIGASI